MKIKDIVEAQAMPLGKVTTVTPAGTDPAKSVVNIKTADGKDIQTTQGALVPGPQGTFQLKPDAAMSNDLKPGATITQNPTPTAEEIVDTVIGGDETDDFIDDVEVDQKEKDLDHIRRLSGLWK